MTRVVRSIENIRLTRLFVYGSLMGGERAHGVLSKLPGARRVARASINGRLVDLGAYPGALPDPSGNGRIHGELWEMDRGPGVLRALDEYEGFDPHARRSSLFVRRRVSVRWPTGSARAWVYFLVRKPPNVRFVDGGDWRKGVR